MNLTSTNLVPHNCRRDQYQNIFAKFDVEPRPYPAYRKYGEKPIPFRGVDRSPAECSSTNVEDVIARGTTFPDQKACTATGMSFCANILSRR
ncbi:hypothetical protein PF010_g30623 [Phytophthora fragariae]|uniref:Uncharacterized protein n=1 Tax=Phytophthora fragariae TaxID=53985 RepID=A0A6G0MDF1_9STRA|nr:hypothetical protein PF010_g30623 [Phytophthora fragariae]KAE9162848.1 hypothetical protein PF004_g30350 [Phytophthora fragariae]